MKKRIFSIIITMGMVLSLFLSIGSDIIPASVAYAENEVQQEITVDKEYLIPDRLGYFTYYVLMATNNTGSDISISADFMAKDKSGNIIKKVNDYSDAVKNGQQFILYGQFRTPAVKGASFEYAYAVAPTNKCAYSQVSLNADRSGQIIELTATNYSKYDIQCANVRTVFMKNGKAVAFDTVNIADTGITFHSGSTNSQVVGMNAGDYDDFVITYTSVANNEIPEDI